MYLYKKSVPRINWAIQSFVLFVLSIHADAATGYELRNLCTPSSTTNQRSIPTDVYTLMNELYTKNIDHTISADESDFITSKGGNSTYGEILPESLHKLLTDLGITKHDILYDLGSGTGKVVIQSYLEFPFKKVVGVELSEKRYQQALKAYAQLEKRNLHTKKRAISFIRGDISEVPFNDATIIYMCSTCFPDPLMHKLAAKFSQLKRGTRIISLKSIPTPEKYKLSLVKEYRLPMSWSSTQGSPVHVYIKNK